LRSRSVGVVFLKELRELAVARSTLLVAVLLGPLVAQAFRTAVDSYAEASGVPGGAAALASALSPLDGIVAPVFGAYAIAATLLFPFVAIRVVAGEKESGAHGLVLQGPLGVPAIVLLKFAALVGAWVALWIPGLAALAMWRAGGGHLEAAETLGVLGGHLLRGALVSAVGIACAAVTESGASAAVLALGVTLGGWALDFTASVRGGVVAQLARFTPESALRTFEHGEISAGVIAVSLAAIAALLALAVLWLDPARPWRARWGGGAALHVALVLVLPVAAGMRGSLDVSEDRRNSFDSVDQRALAAIVAPLDITVFLGPEDPRLADLQRGVLTKLRRTMRQVRVVYAAQSSTGLFEGAGSRYGEVWYQLGDRRAMNRSTTEPIVLETIYGLAGVAVPARGEAGYSGYPLQFGVSLVQTLVLAVLWPLLVIAGRRAARRRRVMA
jgi:ABC-2 type transport system permease protein